MKNESYVWIFVIVLILAVGLYLRFFYQPTLDIALSANSTAKAALYPYQKVSMTIGVFNKGNSNIDNMSIGVLVNGNLTSLYKVTLPVGKQTSIIYNYSPTLAGNYTIEAVADPGKLYSLENRADAQTSIRFSVLSSQAAAPGSMLPKANATSIRGENFTRGGYLLSSYLSNKYGMSGFALTGNSKIDSFITPLVNLTALEIKNITVSDADYVNGSSAYSIWIKGYIDPDIFSVAASASGLEWKNVSTGGVITTFINMSGGTTFCSWYSGGWIKTLSYEGNGTCLSMMGAAASNASMLKGGVNSTLYNKIEISNTVMIGNYSGESKDSSYAAKTFFFANASFIYASISNNTPQTNVCYGLIDVINGTSYCSTYLLPASGGIQNLSLVRTTAYIGSYNFTVLSLLNTSFAVSAVPVAAGIIGAFKIPGNSLMLKSGIVDTCSFNDTFGCGNVTYFNGTIGFRVTNKLNATVRLLGAECYTLGNVLPFPLNVTLASGESAEVSPECFGTSGKLSGFVFGENLRLAMNYSTTNKTALSLGKAFIPFG